MKRTLLGLCAVMLVTLTAPAVHALGICQPGDQAMLCQSLSAAAQRISDGDQAQRIVRDIFSQTGDLTQNLANLQRYLTSAQRSLNEVTSPSDVEGAIEERFRRASVAWYAAKQQPAATTTADAMIVRLLQERNRAIIFIKSMIAVPW